MEAPIINNLLFELLEPAVFFVSLSVNAPANWIVLSVAPSLITKAPAVVDGLTVTVFVAEPSYSTKLDVSELTFKFNLFGFF